MWENKKRTGPGRGEVRYGVDYTGFGEEKHCRKPIYPFKGKFPFETTPIEGSSISSTFYKIKDISLSMGFARSHR